MRSSHHAGSAVKPIDLVDLRLQSRCCIPRPYHAWIVAAVESTA